MGFPAKGDAQTRWRVQWAIERHNGIGSEVLVIKSAHFRREAGEPEVKVLGDSKLAEVFVPYTSPQWFYAIAGQRGSLADLTRDDRDTFATLAQGMARSNGYFAQQSSDLYITDGALDDWLWGSQRIFAYTFEMYPGEGGSAGFAPR